MIRKNLKLFWMVSFLLLTIAGYAQQKTISGRVTDASNGVSGKQDSPDFRNLVSPG